jgi:cytochrome c oxidase cbb3-type subunit III
MTDRHEPQADRDDNTTGHEWDGIRELNNPLPRWWLWTFYASIAFSIGFVVLYPAIPGINGASKGWFGWSSRADLAASMKAVEDSRADILARVNSSDMAAILADSDLSRFAIAGGASAFKVHCVQCHGSDAAGSKGYPNLNDDDWIWGGKPDDIYTTVSHGIRSPVDGDTRSMDMPAFGADAILEPAQIEDVAWFVAKIGGLETDEPAAARGLAIFGEQCASCHGEAGEGNAEFGAPALADAIWFYGQDHAAIVEQISAPAHGVMPAWGERLGETTVKMLTAYVHSLGGGQ